MQKPLAEFLLALIGLKIVGKDITPTVVTGLDALSRNGDLESLRRFIADATQLLTLPPESQQWLLMDALLTDLGTGHGIESKKYVAKQAQVQAQREQAAQLRANEAAATAGGQAAATQGAQPQ
jgi:hypothetical protein